jgi:CRP-like cAMP-binding protein
MNENIRNDKLSIFKKNLSSCVNVHKKTFYNKELILSFNSKRQIGFITYGKASIMKTDINGNKTLLKELKENDIFSNKFYKYSEDNIYIICNSNICEVTFIDYYSILRDCSINCPFHNNLVTYLFDLLIEDNRQQNEKIELLSKRKVEEKILFFLKKRMNENNIFKVTTSYKAIADYLAVDRSNFMRELSKMEKANLIKKDGKIITIL